MKEGEEKRKRSGVEESKRRNQLERREDCGEAVFEREREIKKPRDQELKRFARSWKACRRKSGWAI